MYVRTQQVVNEAKETVRKTGLVPSSTLIFTGK